MRVLLFRHGPAGQRDAARWPDDQLRPLTHRGSRRTRKAAEGLRRLEPGLDLILASPLTRASETATLLKECFPSATVETLEALAPGGSSHAILEHLATLDAARTIALVGHEPDLGRLVGTLLFSAPTPVALKKAGACAIALPEGVGPGAGRLAWFLPPRVLRRLAGRRSHA